ncbi:MAG: nucleotidyltransferase domain-containing protein [Pirellulaceae bacterium]|nr:nucleotidyltransferase domain-containing protein [Pirellulaceae bacterium]
MKREQFTAKLVRILKTLDSASFPARVREVYVFGSYSRGALEPGDLDLLVVHDRASPEYEAAAIKHFTDRGSSDIEAICRSVSKFRTEMSRTFRKPGERVQVLLTMELRYVVGKESRIKETDLVLLWSQNDRNWEEKLGAIRADASAGRAPRDHIIPLSRLHDRVKTMEEVVGMIADDRLLFGRISADNIPDRLNKYHSKLLQRWTIHKVMGVKSTEILRYAMWWLEQHRQLWGLRNRTEILSQKRTHRLEIGKPSLGWMLGVFKSDPRIVRQCLIPHFRSKGPNELLTFERGPNWQDEPRPFGTKEV